MKNRIARYCLIIFLLFSIISTNVLAAPRESFLSLDLISGQPAQVDYLDTQQLLGYFDVNISDVPEDAGLYAGWCIQKGIHGNLHNQPAVLYASTSPNLPADVAGLPWNQINYLLNHKIRGPQKTDIEFIKPCYEVAQCRLKIIFRGYPQLRSQNRSSSSLKVWQSTMPNLFRGPPSPLS